MRFALGFAAAALTTLLASTAHAQPAWPSPNDLGAALQQLSQAAQQAQRQTAACPTIEIAPGVHLPMCAGALPQPPPGVVIPEMVFPAIAPLPAVDLRMQGLDGPVMNQQQTGVCYAFAVTDVLDNSLRRQGRGDVLSPLHFIASGGTNNLFATKPTEALGGESSWPYDPRKACKFETGRDTCEYAYGLRTNTWQSDPQLVAERERARMMGVASIRPGMTTIRRNAVQGFLNALSTGRALYTVIGVDSASWGYSGARGGVLPSYSVADRGDHAVAMVGYRQGPYERQYLLHNSWGTDWGDRGYVWIGEALLLRHFRYAYLIDATPGAGGFAPPPGLQGLPRLPGLPLPAQLPGFPWPPRA